MLKVSGIPEGIKTLRRVILSSFFRLLKTILYRIFPENSRTKRTHESQRCQLSPLMGLRVISGNSLLYLIPEIPYSYREIP
jgi:hypothetical protein